MEVTTLFFFSNITLIGCALIFSDGAPFRKPFYTNYIYLINCFVLYVYNWIMTAVPESQIFPFELYGDSTETDPSGKEVPIAPGQIPNSWMISINAWATLLILVMAFI
jgi:hypothetical protein